MVIPHVISPFCPCEAADARFNLEGAARARLDSLTPLGEFIGAHETLIPGSHRKSPLTPGGFLRCV